MKVGITGGRSWNNQTVMEQVFKRTSPYPFVVITGGMAGAEKMAQTVANKFDLDCVVLEPAHILSKRIPFHPSNFFVKTKQIIRQSDKMYIFTDKVDEATSEVSHAIEQCKKREIPFEVIVLE